jgi:autotransporter family porin
VGDPQVTNNGTITGFVKFTGDNNSIVNNGTFNLRHFADTTGSVDASGNGVRDTLRVAIADLGNGSNNSFTNNGLLALPDRRHNAGQHGAVSPAQQSQQRNDA